MKYPLALSSWGPEEIRAIKNTIQKDQYTMNGEVKKFELDFSMFVGSKYAVMVNSGSSANLLMIAALFYRNHGLSLSQNYEIIVPAVSWSTTYAPLQQYGLKVKFVDVDIETLNFDLAALREAVTKKTKAILAVNLLGNTNNFTEINKIIDDKNPGCMLLEDSCEAMGGTCSGKQTGTHGLMGTFSLFRSHHMSVVPGTLIPCLINDIFYIKEIEELENIQNLKVLTFNKINKISYQQASFIKHKLPKAKKLFEIILQTGRKVIVTEDHSLFSLGSNYEILPILAKDITENTYIVVPTKTSNPSEIQILNFEQFCRNKSNLFAVGATKKELQGKDSKNNYARRKTAPLSFVKNPTKIGFRKQIRKNYIFSKIKLTDNLAKWLGFFVAEGSYGKYKLNFSFHTDEKEFISFIIEQSKILFGMENNSSFFIKKDGNGTSVIISNPILNIFVKDFIGIKSGARNKRIPDIMFHASKTAKLAFLNGMMLGDGTSQKEFTSGSKKLISDISYMCSMLGIMTSVGIKVKASKRFIKGKISNSNNVYYLRMLQGFTLNENTNELEASKRMDARGSCYLTNQIPIFPSLNSTKPYKVTNKKNISHDFYKDLPNLKSLIENDLGVLKVRSIGEVKERPEWVYDFSVPNGENFVGGDLPICLHNSTMEGGMIVTNDEELYHILLCLRAHGWTRNLPDENFVSGTKEKDAFKESFKFILPGYNVRPLEMSGAIGTEQLKKFPKALEQRKKNAKLFNEQIVSKFNEYFIFQKEIEVSSWFGFSMIVKQTAPFTREQLIEAFKDSEIECRPIVAGNFSKNEVVKKYFDYTIHGTLVNADLVDTNGLFVGNHQIKMNDMILLLQQTMANLIERACKK